MDVDAFIVIGGRSSRLGRDKAFVEIAGEPLAVRVARTVRDGVVPTRLVFIAASREQFSGDHLSVLGESVIFDRKPGYNAWSGLHASLTSAQSEWIFITACDYPMISRELLKLMAAHVTDEFNAVVPKQIDGRLQPLCAFYRVSPMLSLVDTALASGGQLPPLMSIFENTKTYTVETEEYIHLNDAEHFFLNINTAADLSALERAALK